MLKLISTPILVLFLALFTFFQNEVSLTLDIPDSAKAGDEFLLKININKGDVEGFGRFNMVLPDGFKATVRESSNGDFVFKDQKIKMQWISLPYQKQITVVFAIEVGPTLSGNYNFSGDFSYIANNSIQKSTTPEKTINIIANQELAQRETSNETVTFQNIELKNIDCVRQKPYVNEKNEVIINLLISKSDLKEFGKIQEDIPQGYEAISLLSKNSTFYFANNTVKFMWMNLPSEPQFLVSYKLVPLSGTVPSATFAISGTFSYSENERTKTVAIHEGDINLEQFATDELVVENKTEKETVKEMVKEEVKAIEPVKEVKKEEVKKEDPVKTKTTETPVKETIKEQKQNKEELTVVPEKKPLKLISFPEAETGLGYRVQIAAGHRLVDEQYFKKLNITDNVQIELHEGWHKYTVGSFSEYKNARDYRVFVWNNTPVHDAFVAAYNNGLRITVQEALMISSQQWYK